jgi:F0F1-type ATP synthase assembly protein I
MNTIREVLEFVMVALVGVMIGYLVGLALR